MTEVIVVIGPGSIGQAIARRVSAGRHVLLADLRQENADAAAKALSDAGFGVHTAVVDVSGTRTSLTPPRGGVPRGRARVSLPPHDLLDLAHHRLHLIDVHPRLVPVP